jgi:hypothetical protein
VTAPPLRSFGLVLHSDGRFTHEGEPIRNRKLRAAFERSVRYLPDERTYVVQLGRFRGVVDVEEAGFFVRSVDLARGAVRLSDGSEEPLDPASLRLSPLGDGALLCTVKRALAPSGLPARFERGAQAELLLGVEETSDGLQLRLACVSHRLSTLQPDPLRQVPARGSDSRLGPPEDGVGGGG